MQKEKLLKMKIAGRFIDLLGHQMYGGPVPAVAEFIANAWDADALMIEVSIPENVHQESAMIIVKDYGEGMTFDELNSYYLNIGYERRKERGEKTKRGRLVMGRKGIGKLAGFGVAENLMISSVKASNKVQFSLNHTALKERKELEGFSFPPEIDEQSKEASGVTVTLKNLRLERNINIESFRKSIARRFALKTDEMKILINGQELTKENLEFEHRTPANVNLWTTENIEGFGKVSFWFGFLKDTIKDSELRGITVFARDRLAQATPFFFNITGGFNGQVGIEYLTGQVKADDLDEEKDYIATDRHSINWQFGKAPILEKWGQEKVKELCKEWKNRKDERNLDKFRHDYSPFFERINNLGEQEKSDVSSALEKISKLERIEPHEFDVIANSLIAGVERESVRKVIRRINAAELSSLSEIVEAIKEWDIITAVSTAEIVIGKIEIIKKFSVHLRQRLAEKKGFGQMDMQTFIQENPWLLGYEYEHLKSADFHHEHGLDKWIEEELKEVNKEFEVKDQRDERRFDLLCIKNDWQIEILELMRPGKPLDYDHVSRLNRYVTRIQTAVLEQGTRPAFRGKTVHGLLIADELSKDSSLPGVIQSLRTNLDVVIWGSLFENVQARYKDFYDILKMKAPNDPRIKGLVEFDEGK